MPERFLVRTTGGPNPGTRVTEGWAWPLPELLLAEGGQYIKTGESILPPQDDDSSVVRGAAYEWHPGAPTAEQLTAALPAAIRTRRFDEVDVLLKLMAVQDPAGAEFLRDGILWAAEAPDA